jgi:hypothetical protein
MAELIGATGWLPHTTRAALSRIRSAGQPLAKSLRPDGPTAYRIEPATSEAEAAEPSRPDRGGALPEAGWAPAAIPKEGSP